MPSETDLHSRTANARALDAKSGWVSLRRGAIRWDIRDGFCADWLDDEGELPISRWLAEGVAEIIKTGPHRTVYRLSLATGTFYLKHYLAPDWQTVLQNLVRPSRADLEWRAARNVMGIGLKTFETIAVGRRRRLGLVMDNFLLSREIPDVQPLDEFVLRTLPSLGMEQQRSARRQIATQLGEIAARLHRGGLLHRDLHPGNVLVQHRSGRWLLYLIDLHALSQRPKLNLRQIALNLSLLTNFFMRLTTGTDRLRFLKTYVANWGWEAQKSSRQGRETIRFLERICQAELDKADARGDKKWLRGNRRLIILEDQGNRCRGLAALGRERLQSIQSDPESLFAKPYLIGWELDAMSQHRASVQLVLEGNPVQAIAATFPHGHLARNAWEMGHALVRRRLAAPRPLLFVETTPGGRDFLAVEKIPCAVSLEKHLRTHISPLSPPQRDDRLKCLVHEVGKQLRKLHDHGFHQPRFDLKSILVREDAGRVQMWHGSLESLQKHPRVDPNLVLESLADCLKTLPAELPIRASHRLRFLRAYLGPDRFTEWKTSWRGIARRVRQVRQEAA